MPTVVREDIDQLNAVLTVTIGKADYGPKFKQEFHKIMEKASMRGFRPGKTPPSLVIKMHGKGVLGQIVSQLLQDTLTEAMENEANHYLGNPMLVEGFKQVEFNAEQSKDYVFKFDVGVAPEFEVTGLTGSEFDYFKVPVPEAELEERMMYYRRRQGERFEAEGQVEAEDLVTLNAVELEGDAPKENGWKTTFKMLANMVADEETAAALLTKQKGDTIRFNVYELEKNRDRDFVKKHLLNFTDADLAEAAETGEMYEALIESLSRIQPAEVNEEFLAKVFGEDVKTEEEARNILKENMGQQDGGASNSLLFSEMRDRLISYNRAAVPLPEDFLKRWLKSSEEKNVERTLNNFDKFLDGVRWTMISTKISKAENIGVSKEEIQAFAEYRIRSYFGGYGDAQLINPMVERIMKDPDQMNSLAVDILNDKLFAVLKKQVKLLEVFVTKEELEEKIHAEQEKAKYLEPELAETPALATVSEIKTPALPAPVPIAREAAETETPVEA